MLSMPGLAPARRGRGASRSSRELIAAGMHPGLSMPRHKLGDEIARDLAEAGSAARVFRGREADDPDAPGEKMCRDLARVREIEAALGSASTHACKSKDGQCEFFETCGYQRQRRQRPDVWGVPHQLLFRPRPAFIKCDALTIDEAFHGAALHGTEKPVEIAADLLVTGDRTVPGYLPLTADLISISERVHAVLAVQPEGRLSRDALVKGYVTADDAAAAHKLEWQRKVALDVYPGMPAKQARAACAQAATRNQAVAEPRPVLEAAATDDRGAGRAFALVGGAARVPANTARRESSSR